MIRLDIPALVDEELLKKIISNKPKERKYILNCNLELILDQYFKYDLNKTSLEKIVASASLSQIKDDLNSCYGNNTEFKRARIDIMKSAAKKIGDKCPYCMLNKANTLDHYFDKSRFPDYSIFIPNLIPCCSRCNTDKDRKLFTKSGERIFIHFYYDLLPEYQFIKIRYSFDELKIPIVNITLEFKEQRYIENIISRHFEHLDLLNKYEFNITEKLTEILTELRIHISGKKDINELTELIDIRHQSLLINRGYNDWETCMLEGLLTSRGFLEDFFQITEETHKFVNRNVLV